MSLNASNSVVNSVTDVDPVYQQYLSVRETRYQQIAQLQASLDAYADAVEDSLLNCLRELAGEDLVTSTAPAAARDLLNALSFLPEINDPETQGQVFAEPPLFPPAIEETPMLQSRSQEVMPTPPPHEVEPSIFPHLTHVGREKAVLVLGGVAPVAERIEWANKHGIDIDWVPIKEHKSLGIIDTVVGMLANDEYAGVVVLDEALNETTITRIKNTCKGAKTPMSYGKKGSACSIWQAFEGIERTYAKKASRARAV